MYPRIRIACDLSYTAKNATDFIQVVKFTGLFQFANKLHQARQFHQFAMSIYVQIKLVLSCHLQTCCSLLEQLQFASSLWITSFDNQLAKSLWRTLNRPVVNKLSQTMPKSSDVRLVQQVVAQRQQTCCNLHIFSCVYHVIQST